MCMREREILNVQGTDNEGNTLKVHTFEGIFERNVIFKKFLCRKWIEIGWK